MRFYTKVPSVSVKYKSLGIIPYTSLTIRKKADPRALLVYRRSLFACSIRPKVVTTSRSPCNFPQYAKTVEKKIAASMHPHTHLFQLRYAMPESEEYVEKPTNKCGHHESRVCLPVAALLVSDHSKTWEAGIKNRDVQSEPLLVLPDLSRSFFSESACLSSSGIRRRLELMNQLLIYPPVLARLRDVGAVVLTCVIARPVRLQSICFSSSVGYGWARCSSNHCFSKSVTSLGRLPRRFFGT